MGGKVNKHMNLDKAKNIIKISEGKRNTAYICPAGYWTIGYGHVITENNLMLDSKTAFDNLPHHWKSKTDDETNELLHLDCLKFYANLIPLIKQKLNENQINALVSFCFNVGINNFKNSSLLKYINSKSIDEYDKTYIKNQFSRWVFAKGIKLKGLEIRRKLEAELFCEIQEKQDMQIDKSKNNEICKPILSTFWMRFFKAVKDGK